MGDALRSSAQQAFLDDGHRVHRGQGLFSVNAVEMNSGGTDSVKTQLYIQVMHPQTIQDVSSSEQIWRNVALHHCLSNGSSAVNGCRQNQSPNS